MSTLSLEQLIPRALDIARQTPRDEAASPCVDCKSEVAILPLQYAVATGRDKATLEQLAPELPANLGTELPPLATEGVRYAVRAMRSGYLYAFVSRAKTWKCESAFKTTGKGNFIPIWPYAPDLPYTPPLAERFKQGGWTILFTSPEDIDEARLLFTPDPLTERMLDRIRDTPSLRNKLQAFDIRQIAMSCSFAPDVLTDTSLDFTVADYLAQGDQQLGDTLARQLFSNPDYEHPGHHAATNLAATATRARGAAVVLHDPIGITQQLNAWRNEAVEALQGYLKQSTGKKGIDNEREVLVAQAFDDVRRQFEEKSAAIEAQHYIQTKRDFVLDTTMATGRNVALNKKDQETWSQAEQKYLNEHAAMMRARVQTKLENGVYRDRFQNKYITPPDPQAALRVDAMKHALDKFDVQCQAADKEAARRAKPHERWLQSEQLLDGLAVYDDADLASGWRFAGQTGLCIFGADGCKTTADLIQQWWEGRPGDDKNLALRSFGLNQKDIRAELAKTLDKAKSTPLPVDAETIYQYTQSILEKAKDLANLFDKANALFEELELAKKTPSGGVLAWYVSLGRQTLRHPPKRMEWFVHGATRAWLAAGVGKHAVNLRLKQLQAIGRSANPNRISGQVVRRVNVAFATELVDAHASEFYRVRASGWLLLLEAGLLALRLRERPKDAKEVAELTAAILTAGAAGLEVLATGTELVLRNFAANTVTGVGATVFLARLRLLGGALLTAGGAILAVQDWNDGTTAKREGRLVLRAAYRLRFVTTVALSASQLSLAFAAAHPMFEILAQRAVTVRAAAAYEILATITGYLANERLVLYLRMFLPIGTAATIVATVLISIFDDDALEKWCQKTIYRGPKFIKNTAYKNTGEELGRLFSALREVT
ncbi:T6SS effector BTH_I2691 family protein [Pseudomonas aeruginosa]